MKETILQLTLKTTVNVIPTEQSDESSVRQCKHCQSTLNNACSNKSHVVQT